MTFDTRQSRDSAGFMKVSGFRLAALAAKCVSFRLNNPAAFSRSKYRSKQRACDNHTPAAIKEEQGRCPQNACCLYTMKNEDDSDYEGSESGSESDDSSDGGSYDYGFIDGEHQQYVEHHSISPPVRREEG